ncbi:Nucleolar protein 8 [Nymphon striatum]|nr:Nucleolar protein 8 [Nymphon striatum]
MAEKRIFVGGLSSKIQEADLKSLFKKFGEVKNVELKSKFDSVLNETKVFAFVKINITPDNLASCFKTFGNSKWKDSILKLEVAKENFLEKLKREREDAQNISFSDYSSPKNVVCLEATHETVTENNIPCISSGLKPTKRHMRPEKDSKNTVQDKYSSVQENLLKMGGGISLDNVQKISQEKDQNSFDRSMSKHERSNQKRIETLRQKANQNKSEKSFIQTALSQIVISIEAISSESPGQYQDSNGLKNSKIKFRYDSNGDCEKQIDDVAENDVTTVPTYPKTSKSNLFGNSSGDEDEDMFQVRPEYEGKKGEKLIALQSKFGNNKRFQLDERFLDTDSSGDEMNMDAESNCFTNKDTENEKERSIKILNSIFGKEISSKMQDTSKFRDTKDLRYDPSNPSASHFENVLKKEESKKPKDKAKFSAKVPEVSSEKFYEVKENLKNLFEKREGNKSGGFSMLSMLGQPEEDDTSDKQSSINFMKRHEVKRTFFFMPDDDRFKNIECQKEEEEKINEVGF